MKQIKSITALLICALITAAFTANAFAETTISKAYAKANSPSVGDSVEFIELHTDEPAKYTARITAVYYIDENGGKTAASEGDEYKDNVQYITRITFTAQSGYCIDENTEYYINSRKADSCDIPCTAEITLAVNGSSYQPDEPEDGRNILQKIADFFSDIIFRIRYFFWSLFPKV